MMAEQKCRDCKHFGDVCDIEDCCNRFGLHGNCSLVYDNDTTLTEDELNTMLDEYSMNADQPQDPKQLCNHYERNDIKE